MATIKVKDWKIKIGGKELIFPFIKNEDVKEIDFSNEVVKGSLMTQLANSKIFRYDAINNKVYFAFALTTAYKLTAGSNLPVFTVPPQYVPAFQQAGVFWQSGSGTTARLMWEISTAGLISVFNRGIDDFPSGGAIRVTGFYYVA